MWNHLVKSKPISFWPSLLFHLILSDGRCQPLLWRRMWWPREVIWAHDRWLCMSERREAISEAREAPVLCPLTGKGRQLDKQLGWLWRTSLLLTLAKSICLKLAKSIFFFTGLTQQQKNCTPNSLQLNGGCYAVHKASTNYVVDLLFVFMSYFSFTIKFSWHVILSLSQTERNEGRSCQLELSVLQNSPNGFFQNWLCEYQIFSTVSSWTVWNSQLRGWLYWLCCCVWYFSNCKN